jgi:iron(III) transport system ATP-binding protein
MGMNNVVADEVALDAEGAATIRGKEWSLNGVVCGTEALAPGRSAVAVIRMERVRLASSSGPNRLRMHLDAAISLGDRWEYRLVRGDLQLRAQGEQPVAEGEVWCECPREAVWLFPAEE